VRKHGGYFLRRHFLSFTGQQAGQAVADFTRLLVVRGHAHSADLLPQHARVPLGRARHLLHADDVGKRDRRRRPAVSIKPRLMALDFAQSRPDIRFLTREDERVTYCDALGIDRARLPQQRCRPVRPLVLTTRYFTELALLGLVTNADNAVSMLFAYIDDGMASVAGFENYLRRYARLLAALPQWRLVYVAESPRQTARGEVAFRRAYGHALAATVATEPTIIESVLDYFRLRDAYEGQRWSALNKNALDRFRDLRNRFRGRHLEGLYAEWETSGDIVVRRVFEQGGEADIVVGRGVFEACVLPYSYAAMDSVRARIRASKTEGKLS
jgi:hypothetical protein